MRHWLKNCSLILIFSFHPGSIIKAQNCFWIINDASSGMTRMPMKVANNAVCEGWLNGNPYMYSFGGIDSTLIWSGITKKSFRYDVNANSWDTIPSLPDTLGKIASAASRVGDTIYIIGGYHVFQNGNEVSSNKVHRYSISTNSYLSDGASIPVPIDDQVQAIWRDSLIFVVTGWSNTTNVANVQIYNPYTNIWTAGTPVPNTGNYKVFGGAGTIVGDTLYYYGGAAIGSNFPATALLRKGYIDPLNPTTITWLPSITIAGNPGYRYAAIRGDVALNTFSPKPISFFGGSSISYNYNAIAYNGSGIVAPSYTNIIYALQWSPQINICPSIVSMDHRGVAEFGNAFVQQNFSYTVYMCGGIDSNQQVVDNVYQLISPNTSVPEFSSALNLYTWPNPADKELTIQIPGSTAQLQLIDITGRSVLQRVISNTQTTIDTHDLPEGLYILLMETASGLYSNRIMIQH